MALVILLCIWAVAIVATWYLHREGRLKEGYRLDLLAILFLALATAGFFWKVLLGAGWMPADGGDLLSLLYPTYRFAAGSLKAGEFPLWNPYLYCGVPFAADVQSSLFYPVNLLAFLLVSDITFRILELLSVFHIFLAGAFMYLCLRFLEPERRLHRLACTGGALAFMFSDLFITHFGNLNLNAAASWLPLVFLFYHRALRQRRIGMAIAAGLALGMAITAGFIQSVLSIAFLLGLYLLYYLYTERGRSDWYRLLGLGALTLLIAGCVTAFLLLPAYEMSQFSVRAEMSYEKATEFSVFPAQLLGLLNPGFFGRGPRLFWGLWDRVEVGYIGILPLILAGLAILFKKGRLIPFLLLLALLSLLLTLGPGTILHGWLHLLPGFNQMRAPARFILPLDFAIAALAAYGLDTLLHSLGRRERTVFRGFLRFSLWACLFIGVMASSVAYAVLITSQDKDPIILQRIGNATGGLVLALLFLGGSLGLLLARAGHWIGRRALGVMAVGIVFIDLSASGAYIDMGTQDPGGGFVHPKAIEYLQSDTSLYRIDTRTDIWDVWQPDVALIQRLFDVGGMYNPLALADATNYWDSMGSRESGLYYFLNPKYIVVRKGTTLDGAQYALAFDGDPAVDVYLNARSLPRAFVVYQSKAAANHEDAFQAIHAPDFDPAVGVVVEGGTNLGGSSGMNPAQIISYSSNGIRLEVEAQEEGYLVMSEAWYPGWVAYVDGQSVPVLRANYAFRAVHLAPGIHQVEMAFRPFPWTVGLVIASLTWLGIVLWGGLRLFRR